MRNEMICGWKLRHEERFVYRANSGRPNIELRFYHYPEYRQRARVERAPQGWKLKRKESCRTRERIGGME